MGDAASYNFSHSIFSADSHNTMEKCNPPFLDRSLIHFCKKRTMVLNNEAQDIKCIIDRDSVLFSEPLNSLFTPASPPKFL